MRLHEMQVEIVDPHTLEQWPDNPNNGDLEAILESVEVNGFFSPLLVQRGTRRIIAGNHRWQVAIEVELPAVPVILLDVNDEQAERMLLADNRTSRRGRDDESLLLDVLDELRATDMGLAGTGYDYDDLARLSELSNDTFSLPDEGDLEPEVETSSPREAESVSEHERSEREALPYSLLPVVNHEDGAVYEMVVLKEAGAFSRADLNRIRHAFGQPSFPDEEIRAFGVKGWGF